MKTLIRRVLLENVEKAANAIANKIFNEIKIAPVMRIYDSASDMLEDFQDIMLEYAYENWGKYFYFVNEEDDEDAPEYVLIKHPEGLTYSTDEMELEMFYKFIDELKDEGFIITSDSEEKMIVYTNIINFYHRGKIIQVQLNEVNGDIDLNIRGLSSYNSLMKVILNEYGIDLNEELGMRIQELVFKKMSDILESAGVREKDGMIKFTKNKL